MAGQDSGEAATIEFAGDWPVVVAAANASAAGRSASRMVLSPTAQRPRRAIASAAAASIGPSAAGSSDGASPAVAPASRKAVP